MKARSTRIMEVPLSTGSTVGLMNLTDDTVVIGIKMHIRSNMLLGLTPTEVRSGKTRIPGAKRIGNGVFVYLPVSKEAAIALRNLLCQANLEGDL